MPTGEMAAQADVSEHYTHGNLLEAIRAGLASLGKTQGDLTADDLAPVDEFHIGGHQASIDFLDQLGFASDMHILDVGCGLGGAARFAALRYESRITGIDLTPEYVASGNILCEWLGLRPRVSLQEGNALAMPFDDGTFDGAYMLHAGMNIADKDALAAEVSRVLKPGSLFGIYDVMRTGPGEITYPVPWATNAGLSQVAEPECYKRALQTAGFAIIAERNRRDFALNFFEELRARSAAAGGPPPLGLHLLMGKTTPEKVKNMIANVSEGRIAPVELIARKL
jgi:ubiquinone/menaquinone biosynthesis C-methylase UbiE